MRELWGGESGAEAVFPFAFDRAFQGIDSERGIAWRVADSPRGFLGVGLVNEMPPDHSTTSRTRR